MGCLKLTYRETYTALKVVRGGLYGVEKACADAYRYGFNGKENDAEGMGGNGPTQDYGFRIYNPALAKFLSVDPLARSYPQLTPYQFASNRPIDGIDLDGLEWQTPYQSLETAKVLKTTSSDINKMVKNGTSSLSNFVVQKLEAMDRGFTNAKGSSAKTDHYEGTNGRASARKDAGKALEFSGNAMQNGGKAMMAFGTASTSVALLSDDPIVCVAATATAATTFTTGAALDLAGGATEFSGQLLKGDFNSSITTGFGEAAGFAAETYAETKGIPKKAASVIGIAVEESTKAIVNEVQNLLQDDSKSSSNPKK